MKQYVFSFRAKTKLAFDDWKVHQEKRKGHFIINISNLNGKVLIYDSKINYNGILLHYGLGIDITLDCDTVEVGQNLAEKIIYDIVAIISFSEMCYIGEPEFVTYFSFKKNSTEITDFFAQVIDQSYPPKELSPKHFNGDKLHTIFKHLLDKPLEIKQSLSTSSHWLRKALNTNELMDIFIYLWIALEPLNDHILSKLGISIPSRFFPQCEHCSSIFEKCPNPVCQKDFSYVKSPSTISGYKNLEEHLGFDKKIGKLRDGRGKLFHTGLPPKKLEELIQDSAKLLQQSLYFLIDIDKDTANKLIIHDMRGPTENSIAILKGDLTTDEPYTNDILNNQPHVFSTLKREFTMTNEYKIGYRFTFEDDLKINNVSTSLKDMKDMKKGVGTDNREERNMQISVKNNYLPLLP